MRTTRTLQAIGLLGLLTLGIAPGCSTEVRGQIVLAVQTDMSLPKDIDAIRIQVYNADTGRDVYKRDFTKLVGEDSIKLPGTIALIAESARTIPLRIQVVATRGTPQSARVVRDVLTSIPDSRVATLPLKIEFLCNGMATIERDEFNELSYKSTCPDGLTCVAGSCATAEINPDELLDYEAEEIFGGGQGKGDGTCFDTAKCFEKGTTAPVDTASFAVDPTTCQATVNGDVNVGLLTQGGGICGAAGCFVALDEGSASGWKVLSTGEGGTKTIALPTAVCSKLAAGEILGVVAAPVGSGTCQLKRDAIPTCGPWSSVGGSEQPTPDPQSAVVLVHGQVNPASLALAAVPLEAPGETADFLHWIGRGTFAADGTSNDDGTMKVVAADGGEPVVLADKQALPGSLALDSRGFVLWTAAGSGEIRWSHYFRANEPTSATPVVKPLLTGLGAPTGIAVGNGVPGNSGHRWLYWSESATQKVQRAVTLLIEGDDPDSFADDSLDVQGEPAEIGMPFAPKSGPGAVIAAQNAACWVYGTLGDAEGVIACAAHTQDVATVLPQQLTPRSVALDAGPSQIATAVYWANFGPAKDGGGIYKADLTNGAEGVELGAVTLVAAEDYPGGVVVDPDSKTVYWTSRALGTVMQLTTGASEPTLLMKGQSNPGAIVAGNDVLYWLNEGTSESAQPSGALLKLAKPTK